MILPHLLHHRKYSDFYLIHDSYKILDNGAAEDLAIGAKHLMTLADHIRADEVVLPDTLGDADDTIAKVHNFTPFFEDDYAYMAVVQGRTRKEVISCINYFDGDDSAARRITTLGIPRLLNDIHRDFRQEISEWIIRNDLHHKFEIHFLGAYAAFPDEVVRLAPYNFRGIDTSLPITLGLQERGLLSTKPSVGRSKHYFDVTTTNRFVDDNVTTYLDWAKYDT